MSSWQQEHADLQYEKFFKQQGKTLTVAQ